MKNQRRHFYLRPRSSKVQVLKLLVKREGPAVEDDRDLFPFGPQIVSVAFFWDTTSATWVFDEQPVVKRGRPVHSFGYFSRRLPINPKRRRSISNMCSNHT